MIQKTQQYTPCLGDIRQNKRRQTREMYAGGGSWKSLNAPSLEQWKRGPSGRLKCFENSDYSYWRRK